MKKPAHLTIFLFSMLFFSATTSLAQVETETFNLQLNKPFYLTGETIWYKIHNTNYHLHDDHSSIVYVNLHDHSGRLLLQQKHQIKDGKASGKVDIPISWEEHHYVITCFTRWNLQFEDQSITSMIIPIYNQFESDRPGESQTDFPISNPVASDEEMNVEIDIPGSISRRQDISLILQAPLEGNVSISIHASHEDEQILGAYGSIKSIKYRNLQSANKEELLTISGEAKDLETSESVDSDVISLYQTNSNSFMRLRSKSGQISHHVDLFEGQKEFQVFNMNPFQSHLVSFEETIPGDSIFSELNLTEPPSRNEDVQDYIRNHKLRTKVTEIFEEDVNDSLVTKTYELIDLKADKVYQLEKYKSLKNFEEFLKEIVFYAELKKNDGLTTIRLKNTETQRFFMDAPWYLVDGYLTRDEQYVLSIPFSNLQRVEIYNTNKSILSQLESVMVRSGMIVIYTKNQDYARKLKRNQNCFTFSGIQEDVEFSAPNLNGDQRSNPNFESNLYWNPDLELKRETQIKFTTSDLMGNFVVRVHGYSADGRLIQGQANFTVGY